LILELAQLTSLFLKIWVGFILPAHSLQRLMDNAQKPYRVERAMQHRHRVGAPAHDRWWEAGQRRPAAERCT
jgi:hypothetical protein